MTPQCYSVLKDWSSNSYKRKDERSEAVDRHRVGYGKAFVKRYSFVLWLGVGEKLELEAVPMASMKMWHVSSVDGTLRLATSAPLRELGKNAPLLSQPIFRHDGVSFFIKAEVSQSPLLVTN